MCWDPKAEAGREALAAEQQAHVEQLGVRLAAHGVRLAAQLSSPADQMPEQELHWEEQELEQGVERAEEEDRSTFGNPNPARWPLRLHQLEHQHPDPDSMATEATVVAEVEVVEERPAPALTSLEILDRLRSLGDLASSTMRSIAPWTNYHSDDFVWLGDEPEGLRKTSGPKVDAEKFRLCVAAAIWCLYTDVKPTEAVKRYTNPQYLVSSTERNKVKELKKEIQRRLENDASLQAVIRSPPEPAPAPTFGGFGGGAASSAPASSAFAFGSGAPVPAPAAGAGGAFAFDGAPAPAAATPGGGGAFAFGGGAPAPAPVFGATAAPAPAPAATFAFGGGAAAAAPTFGASAAAPTFGAAAAATPAFGAPAPAPAAAAAGGFSLGATPGGSTSGRNVRKYKRPTKK